MKNLFAFALVAGLALTSGAHAQAIDLSKTESTQDPITHLKPADWVRLMTTEINTRTVVGKPLIYIVNATGRDLISLTCDNKWQLVGPTPDKHVAGNPQSLPAWRVTLIATDGFDGYCTKSLVAVSDSGDAFPTKLVSPNGTFRDATLVTIMP